MDSIIKANDTQYWGIGSLGITWYHIGFGFSLGLGAALLPPTGALTYAGWTGGAIGSMLAAFTLMMLGVVAVRAADDWRPDHTESLFSPEPTEETADRAVHEAPDSRFKYILFAALCIQLFIFGTALAAGVTFSTALYLLAPLNPLVAGAIIGDMLRLRQRNLEWEQFDWGFPVGALLIGIVGGLGYWYRRGRKRSNWFDTVVDTESSNDNDPDEGKTADDSESIADSEAPHVSDYPSETDENEAQTSAEPSTASDRVEKESAETNKTGDPIEESRDSESDSSDNSKNEPSSD